MNNIVIEINKLEFLKKVMEVAEDVFRPSSEEKVRYFSEEDWIAKIKSGLLVSAKVDEKIVGFAICYRKENTLHIWNVGVVPEYRKNGIWHKIYEEIFSYAKSERFSGLSLNTYKDKFPGMYSFCLSNGFEEYKTEKDELSGSTKSMFLKSI